MITETDIRRIFERVKGNWPRFEHPPGRIKEWVSAFKSFHPLELNNAITLYIQKAKFEPRIGDIYPLIHRAPEPRADSASSKADKFRYIRWQLDRGNCYIRESHPRGFKSWFEKVQYCDRVGLWVFGSLECDRFALRGSADSGQNIGKGEAWAF